MMLFTVANSWLKIKLDRELELKGWSQALFFFYSKGGFYNSNFLRNAHCRGERYLPKAFPNTFNFYLFPYLWRDFQSG